MKTLFLKWFDESPPMNKIIELLRDLVKIVAQQKETIAINNKLIDDTNKQFLILTTAITNLTKAIVAMQKENQQQTELLMTLYVMYDELTVALGVPPPQKKKDAVAVMLDGLKMKDSKGNGGKSN